MIQALFNVLHWPIFFRRKTKEGVAPEDKIEVSPRVGFGLFAKDERKSCPILDTADRAAALLGKPALETYLQIVKVHELWTHSETDTVNEIYRAGYVYNAQGMWQALIEQWTGFAVVPPPLIGTYATLELIFPELFRISTSSRNLLVTVIPWAIYTYDWEEFLAKRASYWFYGMTPAGVCYDAWRELEAVRGRSQPNISDVLNTLDYMVGWFYPNTWFVGKFGYDNSNNMFYNTPGAEQSLRAAELVFLIMLRIRRGLSFRWNGPAAMWIDTARMLYSHFGVNLWNYGNPDIIR